MPASRSGELKMFRLKQMCLYVPLSVSTLPNDDAEIAVRG